VVSNTYNDTLPSANGNGHVSRVEPSANGNGWSNTDVTVTFTCATDPNSGNPAGQYNVGDTITAHVTYTHSFVFPLISTILGDTIDLSSNATFRLEGQPTSYC